ncbi:MAG TPA: AsmA family protein [Porticoccus sp.]|nr:AsmA family protein [Porticoccus sp.]
MKKNNLKKQGGWHWVTHTLLWVSCLPLGLLVIFAVLLSFFDDDDYRAALIWGVDRFLDSSLEIKGPFSVSFGKELEVAARGVHLKADDGSYELSVGEFTGRQQLGSYLKTGTWWINVLTLVDVHVDVTEQDSSDESELEDFAIPPIIIEKVDLHNITVIYRRRDQDEPDTFTLKELVADDSLNQGPVRVYGAGTLDSRAFTIEGTLGALSQIHDKSQNYPIDLRLTSDTLEVTVSGGISDPVTGQGLELQLEINDSHIGSMLQLVDDSLPDLGKFHLAAGIRGDSSAPELDGLVVSLNGLEIGSFEAKVQGTVGNLVLMEELHLDVSLKVPDLTALSASGLSALGLFEQPINERLLALDSVDFSGRLTGDLTALGLDDVAVSLKGLNGVEVNAQGAVDNLVLMQGLNVDVSLKAPNLTGLSSLNLLGEEPVNAKLLELGPVALSGTLTGDTSTLRLDGAALSLKGLNGVELTVQGDVGNLISMQGLQLDMSLKAPNLMGLSDLGLLGEESVNESVLALGPVDFSGKLTGDITAPRLDSAVMTLKGRNSIAAKVQGSIGNLALMEGMHLNVGMTAPDLKSVADLVNVDQFIDEPLDKELLALGPVDIAGVFSGDLKKQNIDKISINIGPTDNPSIKASGIVKMNLPKTASVEVEWDVVTAAMINIFVRDVQPGNLGHLKGEFHGSVQGDLWHIEKATIASTNTDIYQLHLKGVFHELENGDQASLQGELIIKQPMALGTLLGLDLNGFAPYTTSGALEIEKNRLTYHGKNRIGKTEGDMSLTVVQVDGKSQITGSLVVPVLHLSDIGMGKVDPEAGDTVGQEETVADTAKSETDDSQQLFSREILDLSGLDNFDLDYDISINQIIGAGVTVGRLEGQVGVKNSVFRVSPMRLKVEGGQVDINFELDARDTPTFSFKTKADNLDLGAWISQVHEGVTVEGEVSLNIDVQGKGHSVHEFASSLEGSIDLGLEDARFPNKYAQFLTIDVFGWALTKAKLESKEAILNCVMARFDIEQGIARSKLLLADGPHLLIEGRTTLDLGQESMDMVLLPKQKKSLFSNVSAVHIKGPMVDPKVSAVPKKTAAASIGSLVLIPGIVIPSLLAGKLWGLFGRDAKGSTGCVKIIEKLEGNKG